MIGGILQQLRWKWFLAKRGMGFQEDYCARLDGRVETWLRSVLTAAPQSPRPCPGPSARAGITGSF